MKKLFALIFLFALALTINVQAQTVADMYSSYGTSSLKDTVTNTATGYLTSPAVSSSNRIVTVQVTCTELSGTTAGTISLLGSIDGTNFVALLAGETSTAIPTKTALDVASQTFLFRVIDNPCKYYRVSWTGSGTMSDSFTAKILTR